LIQVDYCPQSSNSISCAFLKGNLLPFNPPPLSHIPLISNPTIQSCSEDVYHQPIRQWCPVSTGPSFTIHLCALLTHSSIAKPSR
jgi:hypothetical protein